MHRRENKRRRVRKQEEQPPLTYWRQHEGTFALPTADNERPKEVQGQMCPSGLALHHPAAARLLQYATGGCPAKTGKPWSKAEVLEAIERGPHVSALDEGPMKQLQDEVAEKVKIGQARLIPWDSIKDDPPAELKVSPIAMIPHKSRGWRAILDLAFSLRLSSGKLLPSVNETTTKTAPQGAIDQLGHALQRIIHAFAEAGET